MPEKPPRVLLADDHELFAAGVRTLLEPHYPIVEMVTDGRMLLEAAREQRPDVILCDISMPGLDGIEATRRLRRDTPETAVILLTMHDDIAHVRAAFKAGAAGYLVKNSAPRELLEAIGAVLAGRRWVSPAIAGALVGSVLSPQAMPPETLTRRETEISRLVSQGLENSEIASQLGIAEVTVRTHYSNILQKLDLRNRVELTRHVLQRDH